MAELRWVKVKGNALDRKVERRGLPRVKRVFGYQLHLQNIADTTDPHGGTWYWATDEDGLFIKLDYDRPLWGWELTVGFGPRFHISRRARNEEEACADVMRAITEGIPQLERLVKAYLLENVGKRWTKDTGNGRRRTKKAARRR
jgi:hypothetical protein